MTTSYRLEPGYALTVTPTTGARVVSVACSEDSGESALIRSARTWGPYLMPRTFSVRGDATASTAASTVGASLGGLLLVSDGAPEDATQATINVNPTGNDNGLTFTARQYGAGGNAITVTYVDPGANDAALAVTVAGNAIRVSLKTGVAGAIESTAAEVLAAIEAHGAANELVTVAIMTSDSGDGDDGSGVVTAIASTALAGGAGTGIGIARPGALCIDTTNGAVYRNGGTRLVPDWHANGQFLSTYVPFASAVSITTNTAKDVCTLELPAGEWDLSAVVERNLTGVTATRYAASISLTADTVAPAGGGSGLGTTGTVTQFATFGTTVTGSFATVIPETRLVITEATTIHLVVIDLFSAGTLTAFGTLRARRIV
ncbi:MAG: hypothetical protein RLZZ524_3107 [Pseudomonadota bacterium]|jgi:hypothetical protein